RIHPTKTHKPRFLIVCDFVEQLLPNRSINHLLHMRRVAEEERQAEYVQLIDGRAESADADACELDGANLRLLDGLFFSTELHGWEHLDADAAVGRLLQFLAEVFHRNDSRITGRVDVRSLQFKLGLRKSPWNLRCSHCYTGEPQFDD